VDGGSCQLHGPIALPPRTAPLMSGEQEARMTTEPVWTLRATQKSLTSTVKRTILPGHSVRSQVKTTN